ncbi:MAG: ATP-binding protein, partial [Betaproteobacteria bacterium]|nr:ATP-binding protein [Betaproteobacteria bacterium]
MGRRSSLQILPQQISSLEALTPESAYARKKTAEWLLRLLDCSVALDEDFFACAEWCMGGLRPVLHSLHEMLGKNRSSVKRDGALKTIKECLKDPDSDLHEELKELVKRHPRITKHVSAMVRRECERAARAKARGFSLARVKKLTKSLFGLSDEAVRICEYAFLVGNFDKVEHYFENCLEIHKYASRRLLMRVLDIPASRYRASLKELTDSGILDEADPYYLRLQDEVDTLWQDEKSTSIEKLFCRPLAGERLPLANFRLPADDLACVKALLETESKLPVHILLYGAPGTGKTTFARSLAAACKLKAWAVPCRDDDDENDRRVSLRACLHMAARHKGSFVLVDEAERMLNTDMFMLRNTQQKAWLNGLLEEAQRRVIWIVNDINFVDQAVRRRFTYSIHFEELGKRERRFVWAQILERHHVRKHMSEMELEKLCERYRPPAAVIEAAIVRSKEIGVKKTEFAASVERFVRAHNTLRRNGRKERVKKAEAGQDYSPEGVCMEGSMAELLQACREADAELRDRNILPPASGNMLFYGPPGTGKTALARYIAHELDRECVVKRASDLLSMWVGESEKQVADAFARAEDDGAVLVIDEADSFIY